MQAGVLHTGSKPGLGDELPCSAAWGTTGTLVQPRLGMWPCCCSCDSIGNRDGRKPRASLLLSQLGKGLLYLPCTVR